jgi:hypothetical protein
MLPLERHRGSNNLYSGASYKENKSETTPGKANFFQVRKIVHNFVQKFSQQRFSPKRCIVGNMVNKKFSLGRELREMYQFVSVLKIRHRVVKRKLNGAA